MFNEDKARSVLFYLINEGIKLLDFFFFFVKSEYLVLTIKKWSTVSKTKVVIDA